MHPFLTASTQDRVTTRDAPDPGYSDPAGSGSWPDPQNLDPAGSGPDPQTLDPAGSGPDPLSLGFSRQQ